MQKPTIILVNGLPATGKTIFAEKLSNEFLIPLISRDAIKERIFDELKVENEETSRALANASFGILFDFAEQILKTSSSFILETPFDPAFDNAKIQDYQKRYNYSALQIMIETDLAIRKERFLNRIKTGERHKGHRDHIDIENKVYREKLIPLEIDGPTLRIDTSDFSKIDYPKIFEEIRSFLKI
jgi:predicted kinase